MDNDTFRLVAVVLLLGSIPILVVVWLWNKVRTAKPKLVETWGTLFVSWVRNHWRNWILVGCVFVIYVSIVIVAFDPQGPIFLVPTVAATILTVFLYRKIAGRLGL
jgi:hypothetical protein